MTISEKAWEVPEPRYVHVVRMEDGGLRGC